MVDVEVHTTIDRPRSDVAAYCCDPDNVTAWYANVRAVKWETARPLTIGSRFRFTSDFLGRRLEYTYEVVELVAHRTTRHAIRSEPVSHGDRLHVPEAADDGAPS